MIAVIMISPSCFRADHDLRVMIGARGERLAHDRRGG
jgi:hypothetical protein